ncbi:MAG: DNA-processing protein DprA [Porphyromonadaceae bacterium]|nr:DNA-processing protein DprA [Porphyromonadaceae bacterium]
MIPSETLRQAIALSQMKGMNRSIAEKLLQSCGDLSTLFSESPATWRSIAGVNPSLFDEASRQKGLEIADKELPFIEKEGISPLFITEADYPARLRECTDAPLMLYFKGNGTVNPPHALSIVGTRHATSYGRDFCANLIAQLAQAVPQLTIVSGMAYGIDICAHREALKNDLPTIGVLAHGLQTLYPSAHRFTAKEAEERGGLLTEYTSQQSLLKVNFVARNRIIAGLTEATVVVESAEKGGALITAHLAQDYNREVFALPGNIHQETSRGCNCLIRDNIAAMVTSAEDILTTLGWESAASSGNAPQADLFPDLSEKEALLLKLLHEEGDMQINLLTVKAGLSSGEVLSTLLEMEFKGLVRTLPGGIFGAIR